MAVYSDFSIFYSYVKWPKGSTCSLSTFWFQKLAPGIAGGYLGFITLKIRDLTPEIFGARLVHRLGKCALHLPKVQWKGWSDQKIVPYHLHCDGWLKIQCIFNDQKIVPCHLHSDGWLNIQCIFHHSSLHCLSLSCLSLSSISVVNFHSLFFPRLFAEPWLSQIWHPSGCSSSIFKSYVCLPVGIHPRYIYHKHPIFIHQHPHISHALWYFNIAVREDPPFSWDNPLQMAIFHGYVTHYQRVSSGKLLYFTNLNLAAIKGDDFPIKKPISSEDSEVVKNPETSIVTIVLHHSSPSIFPTWAPPLSAKRCDRRPAGQGRHSTGSAGPRFVRSVTWRKWCHSTRQKMEISPLVNSHMTMENHNFEWVSQLSLWQFSIATLVYLQQQTVSHYQRVTAQKVGFKLENARHIHKSIDKSID